MGNFLDTDLGSRRRDAALAALDSLGAPTAAGPLLRQLHQLNPDGSPHPPIVDTEDRPQTMADGFDLERVNDRLGREPAASHRESEPEAEPVNAPTRRDAAEDAAGSAARRLSAAEQGVV